MKRTPTRQPARMKTTRTAKAELAKKTKLGKPKTLTKEIARQLIQGNPKELNLAGFSHMDVAAAAVLITHSNYDLRLNNLASLSDDVARVLARKHGGLFLQGLASLSDGAARALSRHQGPLSLPSLKGLSDAAAKALACHNGSMYFWALTEVSDAGLLAMSSCLKWIQWPRVLKRRVNQLLLHRATPQGQEAPPVEWVDGRLVLAPPGANPAWQTQTYLSKHARIPTSLFKWFATLLPPAHLRKHHAHKTVVEEMTASAAGLLVSHRAFFEGVRSSQARTKRRQSAEKRKADLQSVGDIAARAGCVPEDFLAKHQRLATMAAGGSLELVLEMLTSEDNEWLRESLLVGATVSPAGRIAGGEPLLRFSRTFSRTYTQESQPWARAEHPGHFAEGIGAIALAASSRAKAAAAPLLMEPLRTVAVLPETFHHLVRHVFLPHARLQPDWEGFNPRALKTLSEDEARFLARHWPPDGRRGLDLEGLTSLSEDVARVLAGHPGSLEFRGNNLSEGAAKALATHQGQLHLHDKTFSEAAVQALAGYKGEQISFWGLTTLSDAAAKALAGCKADLNLRALKQLEDSPGHLALAEKLAAEKSDLVLDQLTELSAGAAVALAKHRHNLSLGLTQLPTEVAQGLARFAGPELNLERLETVDAEAAKALAPCKARLLLWGFTSLGQEAIEVLAQHEGELCLGDQAQALVNKARARLRKKSERT